MTDEKRKEFEFVAAPKLEPLDDRRLDGPITVVVTMGAALLTIIIIALWVLNMLAIPVA
jgi:hypothetical protein